eukprot:5060744-Amphidinium_carterae.1
MCTQETIPTLLLSVAAATLQWTWLESQSHRRPFPRPRQFKGRMSHLPEPQSCQSKVLTVLVFHQH